MGRIIDNLKKKHKMSSSLKLLSFTLFRKELCPHQLLFPHLPLSQSLAIQMVAEMKENVSQVPLLPKYQSMKNKFKGEKCQERSCAMHFGGLKRHNYRLAPHWGLGFGIFKLVVS